jgi:phosphate acetyltransferase
VQHLAGARAAGPFFQGFAKPVSDLSRGASVEDIKRTCEILVAMR